jgi:hypothetical protein
MEDHLGKIWDPSRDHETVSEVNRVLGAFLDDIEKRRVPSLGLSQVSDAAETLGCYAGYPIEVVHMTGYLESPAAGASYQKVAPVLRAYMSDMNALIDQRVKFALSQAKVSPPGRREKMRDEDIPF